MVQFQDKPQANDILSDSQADIVGNFEYINNTYSKEHQMVVFPSIPNSATQGAGRHNYVSLVNQGVDLPPPGDGVTTALYNNGGTIKALVNSAFYVPVVTGQTFYSNTATGWAFLPGGMLMNWGLTTPASSGNVAVTFGKAFGGTPYSIQVTRTRAAASPGSQFSYWVDSASPAAGGFTIINNDPHTWQYYFTAIGPA